MPQRASLILKVAIGLFIAIALGHSYRLSKIASDGTQWIGVPSRLYITKPLFINSDVSGSSADSLKKGDFLLSIDGTQVESVGQVRKALEDHGIDDDISLLLFRPTTNDKFQIRVTRALLPDAFVREIPKAVFIKDVYEDGPAQKAGLLEGDVIVRINHINLDSVQVTRLSHKFWGNITRFVGFDGEASFAAQILLLKHRPGDLVCFGSP